MKSFSWIFIYECIWEMLSHHIVISCFALKLFLSVQFLFSALLCYFLSCYAHGFRFFNHITYYLDWPLCTLKSKKFSYSVMVDLFRGTWNSVLEFLWTTEKLVSFFYCICVLWRTLKNTKKSGND